jgi:N-acetylmuramoyl-L-alanine amidase
VVVETIAAALICLDPGHGTAADVGRQLEPIGPGSHELKIKDGGGAAGEGPVALAIAQRTRGLLLARGYRVVLTRTAAGYRGGNLERARFCNERGAALMLRIHADGSTDPTRHGISTLVPARLRGWTDDVYRPSARAGALVQRELVRVTGARSLGVVERSDLTGFNWADVPVVLAETGFLSNRAEGARLRSARYQALVARGLAAAVGAFLRSA